MKLRYSLTSPYVRKVVVCALELGIDGRIERIATNTADPANGLAADNPLAKVPALLTDDIGPLYDSPVICEYLDSLQGAPKLHPAAGPARWVALRRQALADGMTDAAILRRLEEMRPPGEQSPTWIVKQQAKVEAGLDALEREAAGFAKDPSIDQIAVGCALGYLDFRFASLGWRDTRPHATAWFERFGARPSMVATRPT